MKKIKRYNNVAKKILLFNCKDRNYEGYLYLLKNNEIINLINTDDGNNGSNLKIIKYLDFDMTIKVGVISIKK